MDETVVYYQCLECKDTGWKSVLRSGIAGVVPCDCRQERLAQIRLSRIFDESGQFSEARLDKFDPKNLGQRDAHGIITANPFGNYYLHGLPSRGKSWLLVAQYRYLMKRGFAVQIRTSNQLVEELKAASETGQSSAVMELAWTAEKFHFFLDDLGRAATHPDFHQELFVELIDTIRQRRLGITLAGRLPLIDPHANHRNPVDMRFKLSSPIATRLNVLCRSILL